MAFLRLISAAVHVMAACAYGQGEFEFSRSLIFCGKIEL